MISVAEMTAYHQDKDIFVSVRCLYMQQVALVSVWAPFGYINSVQGRCCIERGVAALRRKLIY